MLPSPLETPRVRLVRVELVRVALVDSCEAANGTLRDAKQAAKLLLRLIGDADREHFVAIYMDARHKPTHVHVVSIGTLTSSMVHPREVFKGALLANASALIVGHNHPSGDVTPSAEDNAMDERLGQAAKLLGIEFLDSIIVAQGGKCFSRSSSEMFLLE